MWDHTGRSGGAQRAPECAAAAHRGRIRWHAGGAVPGPGQPAHGTHGSPQLVAAGGKADGRAGAGSCVARPATRYVPVRRDPGGGRRDHAVRPGSHAAGPWRGCRHGDPGRPEQVGGMPGQRSPRAADARVRGRCLSIDGRCVCRSRCDRDDYPGARRDTVGSDRGDAVSRPVDHGALPDDRGRPPNRHLDPAPGDARHRQGDPVLGAGGRLGTVPSGCARDRSG